MCQARYSFGIFNMATGMGARRIRCRRRTWGKHLINPPPAEPATAADILSLPMGRAARLHALLHTGRPARFSWKVFMYTYLGERPIITLQCLGASFAVAASTVPAWNDGYTNGNVGGLLEAVLSPVGNFGKFLTVMLALSATGNIAITLYSFCMSFQVFIPQATSSRVPCVCAVIPLSIVGQHKFYDTLSNFLGLIGYWTSAFCAVVIVEHLVIRRGAFANYDLRCWNDYRGCRSGSRPSARVVRRPFARTTGDIGFELAFVATALFYVPLRMLELRFRELV
ncbi:uncharacterized protein B0H18DRAFT_982868 [Fomitopsis serialis]|uniref:uncharacterized protein n=1 Tax=Fomitopsis serialis TaxID=139415 RepID=UPI0020078F61|nr:uncharacterized protein B0H18DRAFT_982868 [Neoantrodia serialis]KAH9933938.1 hypothetical protein B0H18DRAFT_982868 [Neoantrodia serialis]